MFSNILRISTSSVLIRSYEAVSVRTTHSIFCKKYFFPETLVIERTYWDYSRNSFGFVQKIFFGGARSRYKIFPSPGQSVGVKN